MKIRFITPYFPPEVGAAQTRIYELAVRLGRLGHEVSVLTTFPNYPTGIVPKEWRGRLYSSSFEDGIRVHRVWSYAAANRGFVKRILSQLSFAICGAIGGLLLPGAEALIIESPPLFDGFIGIFMLCARRTPYVFTVSDLWPESAVQMGMLRNRLLVWASEQIELWFYRRSSAVLALTAGIRDKITRRGIDDSKVLLFRNSVDCELFRPGIDGHELRRELGIDEKHCMVLYAGTLGLAQNLSTVVEAAASLQRSGDTSIRFVLAGDGAEGESLKAQARSLQLANLAFIDPLPKLRVPELLNAADCVLVPLRNLEIFRGALPTKMFEAMACAKPVVLGIEGEAEKLLRDANAGFCITPEDPAAICRTVLRIAEDRAEAQCRGRSGRDYVLRRFSREARASELSEMLQTVLLIKPKTMSGTSETARAANATQ